MDRAQLQDPWKLERARQGKLLNLLRVIDRTKGTQEFVAMPAYEDHGDFLLDGCTMILPVCDTDEERARVIAHFDELYLQEFAAK